MEHAIKKYCVECGTCLIEVGDFRRYWIAVFSCTKCSYRDYLEVADSRNIYPLQNLELGTKSAVLAASEEKIKEAVAKLKFHNYKTVSIVEFENHLRDI